MPPILHASKQNTVALDTTYKAEIGVRVVVGGLAYVPVNFDKNTFSI